MRKQTDKFVDHWQLVLVLWGTKYSVAEVDFLINAVTSHARCLPRVVLITDLENPELAHDVLIRPIPKFFLNPAFLSGGCQAKLAIFEHGVVPDDLPAIYIDIDTLVLDDVTCLFELLEKPETIAMLQSAVLPFGFVGRSIFWLTGGRHYARGNSSIIAYHPAYCTYISQNFKELYTEHNGTSIRPMIADERFISWVAQKNTRAIPKSLAVKFPTEFMWPWRWIIYFRARLPWVQKRWANLVAVTLAGNDFKGENLLSLPNGAQITDRKGRILIWSDQALGTIRQKIISYYSGLNFYIEEARRKN